VRAIAFFTSAAASLVACQTQDTSSTEQAVTNGTDDPGDPAVVGLLASPEQAACTGTLVAPRVVVTAGHCVNRGMFDVFFGTAPAMGGETIPVIDSRAHPQFDFSTLTYDIGVLLLEHDATVAPVPMWPGTFDDSIIGRTVRFAGFGQTGIAMLEPSTKREGSATIAELNDQKFTFFPMPSQPCVGDSGGPGFFMETDGTEYLAGVISSGDPMCMMFARMMRIDIGKTTFIEPYIARTAPGSQDVGHICYYDQNCTTGMCVAASDDPMLHYCSQTCSGPADCPSTMECDGTCRYMEPTPGTLGTACESSFDCSSNLCKDVGEKGETLCSSHCMVDPQCGTGFLCKDFDPDPDVADGYCVPEPQGCCAVGGRGSGMNVVLFMLAALGVSRRRRR